LERGTKGNATSDVDSGITVGTLIDSSVLIDVERGRLDLGNLLRGHVDEDFAISAVTASELLHGVHRARTAAERSVREAFVEGLLAQLPVIPFDLVTARIHARLAAELAAKRLSVGPHDLIIGATAVARGYNVATRDTRSFPKIPGLSLLRW
jgi:predicted nucleic acid-binding protein